MKMIKRLDKKGLILSLVFLFVGLITCEAFALSKITSIEVKDDTVKIEADNKLNYKVDKTDPFNIIVDIDNAQLANPQDKPYTSQKGVISELRAVQGGQGSGNKVRILMVLNTPAEIETKNSGNSLYISLAKDEAPPKEAYQLNERTKEVVKEPTELKKETTKDTTTSQDSSTAIATEVIAVFMDKVQNGAELIIKGNGLMPDPVVYKIDNKIVIELEGLRYNAFIPKTMIFPFKDVKVQPEGKLLKFLIEPEKEVRLAYFTRDIDIEKNVSVLGDEITLKLTPFYKEEVIKKEKQEVMSLSFKEADVKHIFTTIARAAGYDYIISSDINKIMTFEYAQITFDDAIKLLEKEANIKIKKDDKTRTLNLMKKDFISNKDDISVTFSFQDADLKSVLLLLSEISGYNILLHPEIKDIKYNVNTDLKNVKWQKALEHIIKIFALDYDVDEENKLIVIAPIETMQKIEKSRQELRNARLAEYKSEAELYELRNKVAKEKLQALMSEKKITKVIKLKYLDVKTAVKLINQLNIFKGAIGAEMIAPTYLDTDPQNQQNQQKSVTQTTTRDIKEAAEIGIAPYPENNELLLRHVPSVIEEVEEFIKQIDKPFLPPQQVLIETRIIEMNTNDSRDLGVQWGVSGWGATKDGGILSFGGTRDAKPGQSLSDYATTPYSQVGVGQATQGTMGSTNIMPLIINMPAMVTQGAGGSFGIGYINKAASMMLDFRLSALEKIGKSKTISNPKILTLNGHKAIIRHGSRVPTTTPGSTQGSFTTTYIDAALVLSVTPLISLSKDKLLYLTLSVNKDEPNYARTDNLGNPEILARQAHTNVALKDGETIVIGGILKQSSYEAENTVPGLSKIPILGNLFKRNLNDNKNEELLIFVTPRIVEHSKD